MRHAAVRVPATTANLGPGFDAFGLALTRYLWVRTIPREHAPTRVTATGEGAGDVDAGDDNLIWRSLVTFCEHHEVAVPEAALRTRNEVPLERGLGSSSAAIVAGLTLARSLTGVTVGDQELVQLASQIEGHPDNVAPALLGGLVACAPGESRTEPPAEQGGWVVRRVNPAPRLRPLALVPPTRQSTTAARGVLPDALDRADVATQAARAGHVLAGLAGVWPIDVAASSDLLHEPARLEVMAPSGALVRSLRYLGVHAWLSGAGPTVAALPAQLDDGLEAKITALAAGEGFEVWHLDVDLAGALVCPDGGCAVAAPPTSDGPRCVHCPTKAV